MNVVLVCTTDDPIDPLDPHRVVAEDVSFDVQMLPAWRPDRGLGVEAPSRFNAWLDDLGQAADVHIRDFDSYLGALRRRHDFFHQMGCRLSDHGLETMCADDYGQTEIERVFLKVRGGAHLAADEVQKFKSAMLYELAIMDHEKDWTQQYHLGALRNCSTRMFQQAGPDTGFDTIGDFEMARPLALFFDRLDQSNQLCRTILYNLNPRDNAVFAAMIGNYQDGTVAGKMQYGSAWWFLDQIDGMTGQMEALSQLGLLSRFVGMLTDSRSFLSYTRHEYFRRLLCNLLAHDIRRGLIPDDRGLVGGMVQDICYHNAAAYFGFRVPAAGGTAAPGSDG
jgi:glucuronate isomerase